MREMTNEGLIGELCEEGYLRSPLLIEAFRKIDRADFVPEERKDETYGNYPLPIGFGQTISQPLTVAFMLELLEPRPGEKILDVGSGSGWQTALLAQIVGGPAAAGGKVVAIERIPELKTFSENNLARYKFVENGLVKVVEGDGAAGCEAEAPFDKIIAAAAGQAIPETWKDQLKIGGLIVAPVGQSIVRLKKTGPRSFSQKQYFGFSFVPLVTGEDLN